MHQQPSITASPARAAQDVSIIDLDRTLTRRGTYSPFLLYFARHHAPWRLMLVPAVLACMAAYKLGMIERKRLKEIMHRLMMGKRLHRSVVEPIVATFAAREARLHCFDQGRALIAQEKATGRLVILATAAHGLYARKIAASLGIDRVVATESTWEKDFLFPSIPGENCHGPEKLRRIQLYLRKIGVERKDCRVRLYSDDVSDLPVFDWSDEPIAVNPSSKLRAIAGRRGWSTLDWRGA